MHQESFCNRIATLIETNCETSEDSHLWGIPCSKWMPFLQCEPIRDASHQRIVTNPYEALENSCNICNLQPLLRQTLLYDSHGELPDDQVCHNTGMQ